MKNRFEPLSRRRFLGLLGGSAAFLGAGFAVAETETEGPCIRLALLSDTHISKDLRDSYRGFTPSANLRKAAPQILKSPVEGVVICGDAARLQGLPGDYVQLFKLLEPLRERLPLYILPGNHDNRRNLLAAMKPKAKSPVPGRWVQILTAPCVRAILLDSLLQPNLTSGFLGQKQCQWLDSFLSKAADRPSILFFHHTLGEGDGDLLDTHRLLPIVRRHPQVKAIVFGHSHVWNISQKDKMWLINLPALGYNFRDEQPVGWVEAAFSEGGVDLKLHAIAGNISLDGEERRLRWLR